MSRDIEKILERAAGPPASVENVHELWRKARVRRLRDMGVAAGAAAVLVVGVAGTGFPWIAIDRNAAPAGPGRQATDVCREDQFGCVEVAPGAPIKLGTLLAISDDPSGVAVSELGLDSQHGAVLAAELRGNEVAGHPIEWSHEDDLCSPEGGKEGARALAADDHIVAVIGTSCSSAAEVAAPILSERGKVLVSPSNTVPSMTAPDVHQPFYLRTAHNDRLQAAAVAEFAATELGATSAATIHDPSPYSEGLAGRFAEEFEARGGQITAREEIAIGAQDYREVLSSIASTDPGLIYYPLFFDEGALITSQARALDALEGVHLAGSDGMMAPDWVEKAGPANAEGVYLSRPNLEFGNPRYLEMVDEYRARWGEPTSVFHAHAFDAASLILDAIERVAIQDGTDGTTYIPRTALKNELFATSGYEGVTGVLTCDENGDCNPEAEVDIIRVTDGDFDKVWP